MDNATFATFVADFVAACNTRVELLRLEGKDPLYVAFEASIGPRYARVSCPSGVRCFIDRDGNVRQAKSWKQAGRIVGKASESFDYAVAPHMAYLKNRTKPA